MPEWLRLTEERNAGAVMATAEEKLRFCIMLAVENVKRGTGGPFGAAVFDAESRLLAVGVNAVLPAKQSNAHAEMTAIANAQNKLQSPRLADCVLVTSCEPCVMCFGGVLWSGVSAVIYGAAGSEAARIGFDEGDKVADWHYSLEKRNIRVAGPLLEAEAREPFTLYKETAGIIY